MNSRSGHEQPQGVLLTVDACSYSSSMVDLAVAIAASMQGHLRGLFVEDEDLLRVASLPFAREISLTTAKELPTDLQRMQRSLRALASQFKASLQQSAQAADVSWSYEYICARREDIGFLQPLMTFTVLGQAQQRLSQTRHKLRRGRILLLDDHSPNLLKALLVLLQCIDQEYIEIIHIRSEQSVEQSLDELLAEAQQENRQISAITSDYTALESILAARAHEFDYAILSRDADPATQRRIMRQLRCPLILVS